jgi:hypothetical protein
VGGQKKDLDHPKIFIGWCKHNMFFDKGGRSDFSSRYDLKDVSEKRDDHWMGMNQGKTSHYFYIDYVVTDFPVGDF